MNCPKIKPCLNVVVNGEEGCPHQVPVQGQRVHPRLLPYVGAGVRVALQQPAIQCHPAELVGDVAFPDQHRKLVATAAAGTSSAHAGAATALVICLQTLSFC